MNLSSVGSVDMGCLNGNGKNSIEECKATKDQLLRYRRTAFEIEKEIGGNLIIKKARSDG